MRLSCESHAGNHIKPRPVNPRDSARSDAALDDAEYARLISRDGCGKQGFNLHDLLFAPVYANPAAVAGCIALSPAGRAIAAAAAAVVTKLYTDDIARSDSHNNEDAEKTLSDPETGSSIRKTNVEGETSRGTSIEGVEEGTKEMADSDFDLLTKNRPVREIQTDRGKIRIADLPDGSKIIVRPSKDGRPTIEFQKTMVEQYVRFDMANEFEFEIIHLSQNDKLVSELREVVEGSIFNFLALAKRDWIVGFIDNNNIFEADCARLCQAMTHMQSKHFLVMPINSLIHDATPVALEYETSTRNLEHFQTNIDIIDGKVLRYKDCIIFSKNIDWMVIRTGEILYTAVAGPPEFVLQSLNIS